MTELNEKKRILNINAYRIICLLLTLFLNTTHNKLDTIRPANKIIKYTIFKDSPHHHKGF